MKALSTSVTLLCVFLSIPLLLFSCSRATPTFTPPPAPTPTPTPRPTPQILADTFFYGHAYVDANGNGEIDADDPGLQGAVFEVTLSGKGGSGALTGKDGSAFIIIPGGLSEKSWPVRARMRPPPDTDYELVGPEEIVLEYPQVSADFLFAAP